MMRKTDIVPILLLVTAASLALPSAPLLAVDKLEGFYETELSFQRIDNHWQFGPPGSEGMPRHYLELKYLSWPYKNLECFYKLRYQSNRDEYLTPEPEYKRPGLLAAEGHMKFNGDKWETYIFSRQNRFWINDEPLLNLVDQDKIKNDNWGPQSSGVRADIWSVDLWKIKGVGGTFIYFDDGGTFNWTDNPDSLVADGTDNFIVRLRKKSFGDRLEFGSTFLRKDWTNTSVAKKYLSDSYNQVLAFDVSFFPRQIRKNGLWVGPVSLENTSLISEYAVSRDPFQTETSEVRGKNNRYAFSTEVRNIRMSNLTVHAWYNDFGENFRDYMSRRFDEDQQFNRKQYHIEGSYLFPQKAVTATVSYDAYEKRFVNEEGGERRKTHEFYSELYIEFIKGFKGKIAYKQWHGFDAAAEVFDFYTYPNLFAELTVENELVKVRIQGRIRDFDTFREIFAYGYDMEFNATGKIKGYFRILNVNGKTDARSTVFAQIRYDIGYGAECFVEYGNAGQSEHLVNTDYFVNEGNHDRIDHTAKMFLRLYF